MRKFIVYILIIFLLLLTGCVSEDFNIDSGNFNIDSENLTSSPEYDGYNSSNFDEIESIDKLPASYSWTNINTEKAIENHVNSLTRVGNFSTSVEIFIQGDVQLESGSENRVNLDNERAYSKGDIIFSSSEVFIDGDKKYKKRNFGNSSAEVYEVENSTDDYKIFSTGDMGLFMSSMNLEIYGENNDSFVYDVREVKVDNFLGFNKTNITQTKGFMKVGKDGIVEEMEIKLDLKGEPVEVANGTYLPRQIYFKYNSYNVGETIVEEPKWFSDLRKRYSGTKWFDDEDIVA